MGGWTGFSRTCVGDMGGIQWTTGGLRAQKENWLVNCGGAPCLANHELHWAGLNWTMGGWRASPGVEWALSRLLMPVGR